MSLVVGSMGLGLMSPSPSGPVADVALARGWPGQLGEEAAYLVCGDRDGLITLRDWCQVGDLPCGAGVLPLDDAFAQVAGRFKRREVRLRARSCIEGLLSILERKNGWTFAEYAGDRFSRKGVVPMVCFTRLPGDVPIP
ncbi:hypothetical protein ACFYXI_33195 [Microtetraspora malaysiensis]|uniref:Uncharacterized protein n=1 Tax=Microtetraspora malaysiensis TaxID=161358 RepID=A0ABW6T2S0_9ACTN